MSGHPGSFGEDVQSPDHGFELSQPWDPALVAAGALPWLGCPLLPWTCRRARQPGGVLEPILLANDWSLQRCWIQGDHSKHFDPEYLKFGIWRCNPQHLLFWRTPFEFQLPSCIRYFAKPTVIFNAFPLPSYQAQQSFDLSALPRTWCHFSQFPAIYSAFLSLKMNFIALPSAELSQREAYYYLPLRAHFPPVMVLAVNCVKYKMVKEAYTDNLKSTYILSLTAYLRFKPIINFLDFIESFSSFKHIIKKLFCKSCTFKCYKFMNKLYQNINIISMTYIKASCNEGHLACAWELGIFSLLMSPLV